MKIGVITTQYSPNYGALLQTFALQIYLKKCYGKDSAEVINYIPPHAKNFWEVYPKGKGYKNILLRLYLRVHPAFVMQKKKRFKKFEHFIEKNITCSKAYYSMDELTNLEDIYDVLICGSDQIWNITRHDDPAWFLYFSKEWKNVIKIAYAPSIADEIPDGHTENLKNYLDNLDYISVREANDVEQLHHYTSKEIKHVCDPVFLLSQKEWEKYLPDNKVQEPYILCYFISTGDFAVDVVKKVRELTGLKVVHLNVNIRDKFNSDYDVRTADPFEFISYIKNASYICTNSFHCTAFSVLFQKDFLVIAKQMANSRMESLMKKTGMDSHFIDNEHLGKLNLDNLRVDYSKHDIQAWIKESKVFLNEAVENSEQYKKSCRIR